MKVMVRLSPDVHPLNGGKIRGGLTRGRELLSPVAASGLAVVAVLVVGPGVIVERLFELDCVV